MSDQKISYHPLFIALIVAMASFSINGALPSATGIEAEFAMTQVAEALSSSFVFGYALGHLIIGLIGDQLPRKKLLLFFLAGFTLTSLLITQATSGESLLALRFCQGVFVSVAPIIGRSLAWQGHDAQKSAKKLSMATAIFTWAPVFAPMIAAALIEQSNWRASFYLFAVYGTMTITIIAFKLEKDPAPQKNGSLSLQKAIPLMSALFARRSFWVGLLIGSFCFSGFFLLLTNSYNFSSDPTASIFAVSVLTTLFTSAYALGGALSRILLSRLSTLQVLLISILGSLISAFIICVMLISDLTLVDTLPLALLFCCFVGSVVPNATILATENIEDDLFMPLASLGVAKMMLAGSLVAVLSHQSHNLQILLVAILIGIPLISWACFRYYK